VVAAADRSRAVLADANVLIDLPADQWVSG
jgi:hypothetical protein